MDLERRLGDTARKIQAVQHSLQEKVPGAAAADPQPVAESQDDDPGPFRMIGKVRRGACVFVLTVCPFLEDGLNTFGKKGKLDLDKQFKNASTRALAQKNHLKGIMSDKALWEPGFKDLKDVFAKEVRILHIECMYPSLNLSHVQFAIELGKQATKMANRLQSECSFLFSLQPHEMKNSVTRSTRRFRHAGFDENTNRWSRTDIPFLYQDFDPPDDAARNIDFDTAYRCPTHICVSQISLIDSFSALTEHNDI